MNKNIIFIIISILYMECSIATSFRRVDLNELVNISDHILIGEVFKVDMIDKNNKKVLNPKARTGPGLDNEIRLHIKPKELLSSNNSLQKTHLVVSLNKGRHGDLEGYKDIFEGSKSIFFLKGNNFKRTVSGYFIQPISEKEKVITILNKNMFKACEILSCLKSKTINITLKHPYPYLKSDFKCSSYGLKKDSELCAKLKYYNDR